MSGPAESEDSGRRDDVLAGEYVLGVLSSEDRRAVQARLAEDAALAAKVARWEDELSVLNVAYEAAEPPQTVLRQVEARLFSQAPGARDVPVAAGSLWTSLAFWRLATLACLLVIVGMAGAISGVFGVGSGGRPLVAELSAKQGPMNLLAVYDKARGTVRLTPVAAETPAPKSLELWMINGKNAPVSLGVLPQNGRGEIVVPQPMRDAFDAGTVLAVSVEPAGGSPTGAPTGPVVASGPARSL
ncbi:MAG: anti-sigma factor [Pararhizobium sp.]